MATLLHPLLETREHLLTEGKTNIEGNGAVFFPSPHEESFSNQSPLIIIMTKGFSRWPDLLGEVVRSGVAADPHANFPPSLGDNLWPGCAVCGSRWDVHRTRHTRWQDDTMISENLVRPGEKWRKNCFRLVLFLGGGQNVWGEKVFKKNWHLELK